MTRTGLIACAMSIASLLVALSANAQLTEGFDNVDALLSTGGWVNVNNSDVPNLANFNWQQGNPGTFGYNAQSGAQKNSFAQVSYLASNGTITSDWLLTPVLTLQAGTTISFYTTASQGTTFANDLQVYVSLSGASTNVGSNNKSPSDGSFSLLPNGDLNPGLSPTGYPNTPPNGWTLESFILTSAQVPVATSGRIGLRYYIPNTLTEGSAVGIDTLSVTTIPEPSLLALLALGALGFVFFKLREWRLS
jgi:hypothetical protein